MTQGIVMRSESDQFGYPMNHPSNRWISSDRIIRQIDRMVHQISGWIRHRIERMVHYYPTDEFHIFCLFKKKKSGYPVNPIWSDQSDGSSPAKKRPDWGQSGQSGQFDLVRSIRWLITGYPWLSAAWTFWAGWSRHVIIWLTDWSVSSGSHL